MPGAATSDSAARTKPKQYICYLCSKTFDNINILNSHKKLDHGSRKIRENTKPQPPAGAS
jgi:hypothetical protein